MAGILCQVQQQHAADSVRARQLRERWWRVCLLVVSTRQLFGRWTIYLRAMVERLRCWLVLISAFRSSATSIAPAAGSSRCFDCPTGASADVSNLVCLCPPGALRSATCNFIFNIDRNLHGVNWRHAFLCLLPDWLRLQQQRQLSQHPRAESGLLAGAELNGTRGLRTLVSALQLDSLLNTYHFPAQSNCGVSGWRVGAMWHQSRRHPLR